MESLRNRNHESNSNPLTKSFLGMVEEIRRSKDVALDQRKEALSRAFAFALSSVELSAHKPNEIKTHLNLLAIFRSEEEKVASLFIKAATIVQARRAQQAQVTKQP